MAKKEGHFRGVGPYSGQDADSKVRRDESGLGYPEPKSIVSKTDKAWKINDGFVGKLPNND